MNVKSLIKKILNPFFSPLLNKLSKIESQLEENRISCAKSHIDKIKSLKNYPSRLSDVEFKVFSQWGEDGIIQFLISRVPIENEIFIELGVETYHESNTRFLLINNDWRGLIVDGNKEYMKRIQDDDIYWRHDLTSNAVFITRDNINKVIEDSCITGDIGLLSIDVDGNDYWIWESINVVSPRIVVCEYNSIFGCKEAISIPYDEKFYRTNAHHSNLYFGASLEALCVLAEKKGYVFAGSNRAGSNAFFVRKDVSSKVIALSSEEGYVKSKARESRDENGRLTYISGDNRIKLIANKEVVNVITNEKKIIRKVYL